MNRGKQKNEPLKRNEFKKELEFLYRVAQSVCSLSLDDVFREIIAIADEVTKGDSCFIYLLDEKTKTLVLRASKNPHKRLLQKITIRWGEGITGWVAAHQTPVALFEKAYSDSRFKSFRDLYEDTFEAFLSVPIINRRGVVGVINVQHRRRHRHGAMEVNLLSAIGKLVGTSVENARLIEETGALKETLEIRKIIEKAKGIVMRHKTVSEQEAYEILRRESMNKRKSLREIAEAILIASDIDTFV